MPKPKTKPIKKIPGGKKKPDTEVIALTPPKPPLPPPKPHIDPPPESDPRSKPVTKKNT